MMLMNMDVFPFLKKLKYYSHIMKFVLLKSTIQWCSIKTQGCVTITTIFNSRTFGGASFWGNEMF